jgi:hypothetical protein
MPVPQQNSRRSDVCFGGKYTIVELVAWISADFLCIESGAAELVAGQVQVDTTPIGSVAVSSYMKGWTSKAVDYIIGATSMNSSKMDLSSRNHGSTHYLASDNAQSVPTT